MLNIPHEHGQNIEKVIASCPSFENFVELSDIFRYLNDPSRLKLFWLLCHLEECVINLSSIMQMSSPAISHHLRQLKSGGLITSYRKGKEVYYKANDNVKAQALHEIIEKMIEISCPE